MATEGAAAEIAPNTTSDYRFVSDNVVGGLACCIASNGKEAELAEGPRRYLHHPGDPAASVGGGSAPNAAFRTGLSAFLPGCRAYEMVSPLDKDNGDVFALFNSLNERAAFPTRARSRASG